MNVIMYSETYGGPTTTFIRNTINALLDSNYKVLYICSELIQGNKIDHQNFELVVIRKKTTLMQRIIYKLYGHEYSKFYLKNNYLSKEYNSLIEQFKPDIIHCQFFNEALWLLENIEISTQKIICQFHGYDASKLLRIKQYLHFLVKYSQFENLIFFFVSNSLKKNIEININKQVRNGRILNCGIDTNFFNRSIGTKYNRIKSFDTINFLQISSLTEKKGHEYTLKALAIFKKKFPKKKIKYTICGDGPLRQTIMHQINQLFLTEEVELIGKITPLQAKEYLLKSEVFLHHSVTSGEGDQEGIPTAIMEAMAMGIPIISTYHSGLPELVSNNKNGILVEERNIDEYVTALEKILEFNSFIPESVEKIKKSFSLVRHKSDLNNFYEQFTKQ